MQQEPFLYQKTNRFFAQVPEGMEDLAIQELSRLGAERMAPDFRGVYFTATHAVLYRIIYTARLLTRVLSPLFTLPCRDRDDLYRAGRSIDWSRLFSLRNTFGIFSTGENTPNLRNSKYAALCLKDAIADHFRSLMDKRPYVDKDAPDVWINLHIEKERATISLDVSGGSLHRRGYRRRTVEAPLQETLAAAMVALSGWHGEKPLYDPLCGSGTLLCEAMMHACNIPSGMLREKFGFRFLPDYSEAVWNAVKESADHAVSPLPEGRIAGSDSDPIAVMAAHVNCRALPGGESIQVWKKDFNAIERLENSVILCNPPYGIRLGAEQDLGAFYKAFGDFLKRRCRGSEAYIFFGNREMIKSIGLKPAFKKPIQNAGLDARIVKYELY